MGESNGNELALLDQASQVLAEATSIDEIKQIRNKAEAVRKYAQSALLGLDVQNRAAELKLRAERQAGKLLSQMMLRGGDRRSKDHAERLKLEDLGISRNQSTRWQMQARLPDKVFREHIKQTCAAGKELTSAKLMRLARQWHATRSRNVTVSADNNPSSRNGNYSSTLAQHSGLETNRVTEIATELNNHHQLIEGILRPIYSGESTTLLPAERRILRYLMIETAQLLKRLATLPDVATGCTCHVDLSPR